MKTPFHQLTAEQRAALPDSGMTYAELAEHHPQPSWCGYPDAVFGMMGCWSLVGGRVTGQDFCRKCEFYEPHTTPTMEMKMHDDADTTAYQIADLSAHVERLAAALGVSLEALRLIDGGEGSFEQDTARIALDLLAEKYGVAPDTN